MLALIRRLYPQPEFSESFARTLFAEIALRLPNCKGRLNQFSLRGFAIILGVSGNHSLTRLEAGLSTRKDRVFVGLASIPSRVDSLEQVIKSLLPQVDQIGVYLNNYQDVPAFLRHSRIRVARSQKHGDVRDNGKFFFVEKTKADFYATVDDDIKYPDNYIAELIRHQKLLGGTHAVGVHGSIYPSPVKKLLTNRYLFHFSHATASLTPVDMLGTGTLLFNRRYWGLRYSEILAPGMADVWFAAAAAKRGFGLWSIPRPENWMHALEQDEEGNLFQEGKIDDSVQVAALNEAAIGSTRESLLERIVRIPFAGSDFSIDSAVAIAQAAARLSLPPIEVERLKLFAGAIVAHKRESKATSVFAAETSEVDYVEQLLKRVAGIRDADQVNFETAYLVALDAVADGALPEYQKRDKALLAAKAAPVV